MTKTGSNSGKSVQSVHTAFDVIEFLRDRDDATVTEVADGVGMSVSSAYSHLVTLADRQYVEKVDGRYRVGVRFLTLGGEARTAEPIFREGNRTLEELAARTGETARLVVERAGYGITLCQATGDRVETPPTYTGIQETLHSTAAGKAILAHYPRDEVKEILDERGTPRQTGRTITDREELADRLDEIRDRGVAFDRCEHFEDVVCVAGPIITEGEVLGAVSLSAPTDRRDEAWLRNEAVSEIQNATGVIKVNSTYSSWTEEFDDGTGPSRPDGPDQDAS